MAVPGDHVEYNERHWNEHAHEWVAAGERRWRATEPIWGIWRTPETQLKLLPAKMAGLRAIELGCGTGYVSAWMTRRGAEVVGVDVSFEQLSTARRLAVQHGLELTLHHASAENVPEGDATFDFAMSEYGAAIWCDPELWIAEAARVLKPGGRLVFLGHHPLLMCCYGLDGSSATNELVRDWFGMRRFDWTQLTVDPGGIEFNLTTAEWMRLFKRVGFVVDDYIEIRAPDLPMGERFDVPGEWARRFPSEQVWKLTRR